MALNEVALTHFNASLDENASILRLNEAFLEAKVNKLENIGPTVSYLYWLSLARVNELALLCAGNYADNFEFSAAGDLLVNPRKVLVHIRNHRSPIVKERHVKLSEQFQDVTDNHDDLIDWMKNETTLEMKEKPLLPFLFETLRGGGFMSRNYLKSSLEKMNKIANAIGFFGCSNFTESHEFYIRLQNTPESEKDFIKSKFCRFNMDTFDELGKDFHRFVHDATHESRFLSPERNITTSLQL